MSPPGPLDGSSRHYAREARKQGVGEHQDPHLIQSLFNFFLSAASSKTSEIEFRGRDHLSPARQNSLYQGLNNSSEVPINHT